MATAKKATAKKSATKTTAVKSAPKKATAKKVAVKAAPTHDEIATLARKYWSERGHHHGNHVDDWLRAEHELSGKA